MKRKIVNIEKDKCNGCGLCAKACHEGAIEMIDGKATLVSDEYCDGLGDCLPECPTGAIKIIERESAAYDEEAVQKKKMEKQHSNTLQHPMPCGCPGSESKKFDRKVNISIVGKPKENTNKCNEDNQCVHDVNSELNQWPVQLKLINSRAQYLNDADLLVAADCTAYAYGNFHKEFIKGHITVVGCPKLDDNEYYTEKLAEILKNNTIKSITVVRMEVPCCGGIVNAVKNAMLTSGVIVPYKEVTISTEGKILD